MHRRDFFRSSATLVAGFAGLRRYIERPGLAQGWASIGYGELVPDPEGVFDLPAGFKYQIISRTGERMSDGFLVPGAHDGMAAFRGREGATILVRNHELMLDTALGPFGADNALISRLDAAEIYDPAPALGGTTTLIYNTREQRLERHFLSLTGTMRNCAGGPTPWGSWISCEENVQLPDGVYLQRHGYNFEVPSAATRPVRPVPLRAMGRFNREAVAVDAATGIVYQTEDRVDSLFYRFIPMERGNLAAGGRLQALKIRDVNGFDTSNNEVQTVRVGRPLEVEWVDLEDVESPDDDLRLRGFQQGASRFSRGEGMWALPGAIYFACTGGGRTFSGQIWRYHPGPDDNAGIIELFIEPDDIKILDGTDNLTFAPWGDLIICEDGLGSDCLIGVTPGGEIYPLARNVLNEYELAGVAFSPDGSTLFVNIQIPGLTLAITGPWKGRS